MKIPNTTILSVTVAASRRGRPRIHKNDSAKTTAYRARVRQRRLESAPADGVKHHRYCTLAKLGYCLCDWSMSRGLFLTGAPISCGLLVTQDHKDLERNGNKRFINSEGFVVDRVDGQRVAPSGYGIGIEDKKQWAEESDDTFINNEEFPLEWKESDEQKALRSTTVVVAEPTCCQCEGQASVVHPEDGGKRLSEARFLCGEHAGSGIS